MKTSIFILSTLLSAFGLAAVGYVKWEKPKPKQAPVSCQAVASAESDFVASLYREPIADLVYNIDSRFIANITKEKLQNAKTIIDLVPEGSTEGLSHYETVQVVLMTEEGDIEKLGTDEILNKEQKALLSKAEYGSNFYINAYCKYTDKVMKQSRSYKLVYFISVIPEHEAEYAGGNEAVIEYLKENSVKEAAVITQDKLRPGRFLFTVSTTGKIKDVQMTSTSGYPTVDEKLVDLLANMPGTWSPAKNSKGEAVEQQYIFFFGKQGC